MNFTYVDQDNSAKIKVIGVGNEGGNAINSMIDSNLSGVQFIVANTDSHSLAHSKAKHKIQLKGLIKKRYGEEDDKKKSIASISWGDDDAAVGDAFQVMVGSQDIGAKPPLKTNRNHRRNSLWNR